MRLGDRSGASHMGRGHREGFCKTLHSAPRSPEVASFLLQNGMSQPPHPPPLVQGQLFQSDLLDSQQAA